MIMLINFVVNGILFNLLFSVFGMFNMMCNFGGLVGIVMLVMLLINCEYLYSVCVGEVVSFYELVI